MMNNDLSNYGGGERMTDIIDSNRTKKQCDERRWTRRTRQQNETPEQRDSKLVIRWQRNRVLNIQCHNRAQTEEIQQITTVEQDITVVQLSATNPTTSPVNNYNLTVDNPSIVAKMNKFHEHVAQLHFLFCTTCKEGFPTVTLCAQSSECTRCSRD